MAAPAGMVPSGSSPDIAAEYADAKGRRDRAAAELAAQTKRLSDAANDAVARAQAGRAVEAAQKSLASAQTGFDAVVRKMKPGDAIWIQETAVGMTNSGSDDRYSLKVPGVGEGVEMDPRLAGGNYVGEVPYKGGAVPPLRVPTAPGTGPHRSGPAAVPVVGYGKPPGYDNDKMNYIESAATLMGPGAPKIRDPRPPRSQPPPEGWPPSQPSGPAPPEEGIPFAGPLPEAIAQVGFVVFPQNETFPTLLAFEAKRPGAGSLKVLTQVASAVQRGDVAGAAKSAEFLAKRHPDDPGVRRLAAILALRLGRLDEADSHISAALKIDPTNAEGWTVLAWLRLRQGRRAEAGEAARWSLALDPTSAAAAAALKASGVPAQPAAGAVAPPPVAAPSPFVSLQTTVAPEPEAPPESNWGSIVLAVAAVSGAALAYALKGLIFRRKV